MVNYKSEATEEEKHENILNPNKVSEESGSKNRKSKKNKRKYKEESVVIVDCEEEIKKKKHKYLKENVQSDKNEVPAAKKKRNKSDVEAKENDSKKPANVPAAKEKPNESDVEAKENDSKKPANADGKKRKKARHSGRAEKKKEKAKKKELIANGTTTPETKTKNKKRKRKARKNKKDKNSAESQANNTPQRKGDIPLEDTSAKECKAKEFLNMWNKDKTNWKFVKNRQNWLLHHLYDPERIDDKMFKVALNYLAGMKGSSRGITLEQAKSVLNVASGDATTKIDKKIVLSDKPGEIQLARAREVIQML